MSLNLAITLIMLFVLLYAEQCPGDVTQQTLQICNMGDAELAWSLSEGSVSLPDVLLLHADDDSTYGSPIQGILQAYGDLGAVDLYDARSDTPTLAQLLAYDVVLTWSRDYYHDQVAIGDVLADYVDAGGKVINLNYSMGPPAQQMEGRFMDEGYTAMDGGLVYFGSTCLGTYNPDDPIMAGVTQVCDSVPLADTYLTPGSHAVAWWAGGAASGSGRAALPVPPACVSSSRPAGRTGSRRSTACSSTPCTRRGCCRSSPPSPATRQTEV